MIKKIVLKCTPLRFYTQDDEDLCFEWINKIGSVKKIKGVGRELHLTVLSTDIPGQDLLNLMGLFDRYKFDQKQLRVFLNEKNKEWFDD